MSDVLSAEQIDERVGAVKWALQPGCTAVKVGATVERCGVCHWCRAHDALAALARSHEQLRGERDDRLTRESGMALIEDATRWSNAYTKARDELAAAVRAGEAAAEALRRVKDNAESWHGNGEDGPRRALVVIANWCDDALSAYDRAAAATAATDEAGQT